MKHDSTLPDPPIKPPNTMSTSGVFLLTLLGAAFVALLIWIGLPLFTTPGSPSTYAPPASSANSSVNSTNTSSLVVAAPATYPPEILMAARAQATYYAPTPTPTPSPPRPTPTPIKELWCPDDPYVLPTGTVCRGVSPLPSPTPMPTYPACTIPAQPEMTCQVRYGRAEVPMPVATPLPVILTPVMLPPGPR
jgi:hypothetical protein